MKNTKEGKKIHLKKVKQKKIEKNFKKELDRQKTKCYNKSTVEGNIKTFNFSTLKIEYEV